MKNLFIISLVFSLLSCNSEDDDTPQVNQKYLDQLLGFYELKAAFVNNPIYLNGDGVKGIDFF